MCVEYTLADLQATAADDRIAVADDDNRAPRPIVDDIPPFNDDALIR